jgi:cyclohexanecarboxylate-CoA ligase
MGTADTAAALAQVEPRVVLTEPGDVDGLVGLAPPVTLGASAARPADLAVALFTSGSTGAPKAVLHTQRGLAYKARLMRDVHGLTATDAVLMPAPLAHISGLLNGVLLPGVAGMRTVLMERWDPEEALDLIASERITFMIGPPTFFVTLMAAAGFSAERVQSLRLISSGGAGVTPAFVEQARDAFSAVVKRTYGSTEAPTVTTSHRGDPLDRARDTDGRPTGEVELRIGAGGELWLRGPELFVGYADPLQTRTAHARGGWFRTGDLATIDDGWLTVVGRIKDVVIRGGENISVAEVEGVLEAHPAVRQAAVVGYPDEVLGERVAAFVVADIGFDLDAVRAWFAERGVTRFKTPERVVRLDALPTLAAGKPDRAALRELARRA